MKKDEVKQFLLSTGKYNQDNHGNLKSIDGTIRFKFNPIALRYERKVNGYTSEFGYKYPARWVRIVSGYYKDLYITENNKIGGLKR